MLATVCASTMSVRITRRLVAGSASGGRVTSGGWRGGLRRRAGRPPCPRRSWARPSRRPRSECRARGSGAAPASRFARAARAAGDGTPRAPRACRRRGRRSEEHTSELQSHSDLVCRLLLEKKKKKNKKTEGNEKVYKK